LNPVLRFKSLQLLLWKLENPRCKSRELSVPIEINLIKQIKLEFIRWV